LAFVAVRGAELTIYDVSASTLAPLGALPGVFGNMSFDSCRGLAYVHGLNGALHVIDFNDPTRPVDLNDEASPFTVQSLGSALNFNGNANAYGVVYLAGEGGIAIVRMPASSSFGRSCAAAPATTASSSTTSPSFPPTALAVQTLTSGSTGVSSPFGGPTSAKFRARVACRECQTPALKLPDDLVYELPQGFGWTGTVEITPNEGLVLKNVALHQLLSPPADDVGRKMLRQISVPFIQYRTNADPELESRLCPTNTPDCVSRLVYFQPPKVTSAGDKIVTQAEYLVGATDDANSCLRVIQRYEFTREVSPEIPGAPMCEPTESTALDARTGDVLFHGLTCARLTPQVSYEFLTNQHNETIESVVIPQRLEFDVDGASRNVVALLHDCEPLEQGTTQEPCVFPGRTSPPDPPAFSLPFLFQIAVPGIRLLDGQNPHQSELFMNAFTDGTAPIPGLRGHSYIDNFHQTSKQDVDLPIPPPGCPECVHIHWRWFRCDEMRPEDLLVQDGCSHEIDKQFGRGRPLIPLDSTQSLDVAVLNAGADEENRIRAGTSAFASPARALGPRPVLWQVARTSGAAATRDVFFSHGIFFSTHQ
jgi:hypothetical protein